MATLNQYNLNNTNGRLFFSVVENPVVEPIDGPLFIEHLIQRFPEEVYSRSRDSHLFRLLTALAGDSGAGILKKKSLLARLQYESALLGFQNLDNLYSPLIGFERLPGEKYLINPKTSTLTQEEWDAIKSADTSYRRRAMQYLQAARQGGTVQGITDAASAALGQEVQVVENYRYIFDQNSDRPLGVKKYGITDSANEFVIRPNVEKSASVEQPFAILTIFNDSADDFYFSYEGEETENISPEFVSAEIIRSVLEGLEQIEQGYVVVEQTTSNSYRISFSNSQLEIFRLGIDSTSTNLTDEDVLFVQSTTNELFYNGRVGDPSFEYYNAFIGNESTTGIEQRSSSKDYINPYVQKNLSMLIERLKPQSSLFSIAPSKRRYVDVPIKSAYATSERFYVNRFVTGNPNIAFVDSGVASSSMPQQHVDLLSGRILEPGVENEERNFAFTGVDMPVVFMTIDTIIAYTDAGDLVNNTSDFYDGPNPGYKRFESKHIGLFAEPVSKIFPFLQYYDSDTVYGADQVLPSKNTNAKLIGAVTA